MSLSLRTQQSPVWVNLQARPCMHHSIFNSFYTAPKPHNQTIFILLTLPYYQDTDPPNPFINTLLSDLRPRPSDLTKLEVLFLVHVIAFFLFIFFGNESYGVYWILQMFKCSSLNFWCFVRFSFMGWSHGGPIHMGFHIWSFLLKPFLTVGHMGKWVFDSFLV